jgi:hypothetical protein
MIQVANSNQMTTHLQLWPICTRSRPRASALPPFWRFRILHFFHQAIILSQNHPGTQHPYLPLVIQPKPKPEIPGMSSGTPSCTRDPRLVRAREASSGTGDIFQGCFVSFVFFSLIGLLSKAESLGGCRGRDLYTDDLMDSESRECAG